MRQVIPAILMLTLVTATPALAGLPRGTEAFTLGMSRGAAMAIFERRGLKMLSDHDDNVAFEGQEPDVEFERYSFLPAHTNHASALWQVTIAYRLPLDQAAFDQAERELTATLGIPPDVVEHPHDDREGGEYRTWTDGLVAVTLSGHPGTDPPADRDRMLIVWTDRRLQALARSLKAPKPKSSQ